MDKFTYAISFIYIYSAFDELIGKLQVYKKIPKDCGQMQLENDRFQGECFAISSQMIPVFMA
jgi:hypothetical protein